MGSGVVVVDSHPVTRWGLKHLIESEGDFQVVGDTGTGREAVSLIAALRPAVVTIAVELQDVDGLQLARHLRDRFDDLGIVILTSAGEDDVLLRALETGVSAFVPKSAPVKEIVAAIRHASVAASSFTASGLAAALRRRKDSVEQCLLSTREREVLDLLAAGKSVPTLAAEMHISLSTAKTYVARLYDKLGARNRAEALMSAVRLGLTSAADVAHTARVPA